MPPGLALTELTEDAWQRGLGQLTDDELIGVMRAARRLASRAAALELSAVADLAGRRRAGEATDDGPSAGEHVDAEVAAALTLTTHAAARLQDLALGLRRLPGTMNALAAGRIDEPRAAVIAAGTSALDDVAAGAVSALVIRAAPGQTTGQLRASVQQAVIMVDPAAAQRRKEAAQKQARVELWREDTGTCALSGRDLPPGLTLAADKHLTAAAELLKARGADGTLGQLRARAYLGLLCGLRIESLLPANRGPAPDQQSAGPGPSATRRGTAQPEPAQPEPARPEPAQPEPARPEPARPEPAQPEPARRETRQAGPAGWPKIRGRGTQGGGWPALAGSVNLTLPLTTWLGWSQTPGQVPGFGPLDAQDSRILATFLARHPATRWCLTLTDSEGQAVAHGCASASSGPPPGRTDRCSTDGPGGIGHVAGAGPPGGSGGMPVTGRPPGNSDPPSAGRGSASARSLAAWLSHMTLDPLTGPCDHAQATAAYRPSLRLRHLARIRHQTCTRPGCRRPAAQCDLDHTLAYDEGGLTCLCNIGPACRRDHQCKQAPGWSLTQATPGYLTWTTPAGRAYTTGPATYLA